MKPWHVAVTTAVVMTIVTSAVAATPEMLYEKAPWAVARVTDLGFTTCQARVLTDGSHLFQVVGTPDLAFIGVGAQDWNFARHNGWLTLKVGISASKMDGALYDGNFVRIAAKVEAIYGIMLMINRPGDLDVLDENDKLLATFPFTGWPRRWRSGRNASTAWPRSGSEGREIPATGCRRLTRTRSAEKRRSSRSSVAGGGRHAIHV